MASDLERSLREYVAKWDLATDEERLMLDAADALARLEQERDEARTMLAQAIAEIENTPYATEAWGWGIAYRIDKWRAAVGRGEREAGEEAPLRGAPDGETEA